MCLSLLAFVPACMLPINTSIDHPLVFGPALQTELAERVATGILMETKA